MRLCVVIVGLACAAAACGSQATAPQSSTSPSVASAEDTQDTPDSSESLSAAEVDSADGQSAEPTSAEPAESISEFLGVADVDDANPQASLLAAELGREDTIALCMKQKGFDYFPRTELIVGFEGPGVDGLAYNSREYVERFGFGITTLTYSQTAVGLGLVGNPALDNPPVRTVDPNEAYYDDLGDSARLAYDEALRGPPFVAIDHDTATAEELAAWEASLAPSAQGCMGEAFADETYDEFYATFGDALREEVYNAAFNDPRMAAAEQEANECIARAGFDFSVGTSGSVQLKQDLVADLAQVDALLGPSALDGLTNDEISALSVEQLDDMLYPPQPFTDEAKRLLGELQENEVELALAVFDCGGWESAKEELYDELVAEYEKLFLDRNAGLLDEFNDEG